ncbi:MAG: hypothetical protein QOH38_880, partial [Thermoleophilaceae bacterium]|nr:hypothetical protein [Thermoleophilaceae bacterium]
LRRWPLLAAAAAAAVVGCGGSGGSGRARTGGPAAVPKPRSFPEPGGRTLAQLRSGLGPGPRLATSVSVLQPGRNRVAYALFDRARRQIVGAPTALYVARADGHEVRGPYRARYHPLTVKPEFASSTSRRDPDSAKSIYVASPEFPRPGRYQILGVSELDQRVVGAMPVSVAVRRDWPPPNVGDAAPRVHTPTRASTGGDLGSIDTRVPPDSMHDADLADVLGRRPVMLLFATPGLCPSRICAPVVDIAEQLKAGHAGDAAFIHMEIYNENRPDAGERPQVRAYGLPSEPWLFAIDRSGHVAARIEGAFSLDELKDALRAATEGARPPK